MRSVNQPPEITIPNIADAEISAMTQAMYSRSNKRIKVRLEELDEIGEQRSKNSLKDYYLGYGHSSINDCGFTTIYIEGISNIAAKAIEDTPLFNGQESSTRYLDFSQQSIIDPFDTEESKEVIEGWLDLYLTYQPMVVEGLRIRYPKKDDEDESVYERAIKARSFDIMRGILPCGVTTQLSWTTSLRHARDRIRFLKYHPCKELRDLVKVIHEALIAKYPSSFKPTDIDIDEASEEYNYYSNPMFHYLNHDEKFFKEVFEKAPWAFNATEGNINGTVIEAISSRPDKSFIPTMFSDFVTFRSAGLLDFGSYRDLQRHRRGWCPIPVVRDYGYGINGWYIEEIMQSLSKEDFESFSRRMDNLQEKIVFFRDGEEVSIYEKQYLYPMGINIIFELAYNLPQAVYFTELRSQPTVHETLRVFAQRFGEVINNFYPGFPLSRYNDGPSSFMIERGKQTIFKDGEEIT